MEKDFLQSEEWRKFQEAAGRRTFLISDNNFHASIIEHELPIVGKYFYIPRGPICHPELDSGSNGGAELSQGIRSRISARGGSGMTELIDLTRKENAGWIRIDTNDEKILKSIAEVKPRLRSRGFTSIKKAPHDMQPKEIFIIDISKPEEELLAEMKSKTRYNVKLAEKKGVKVFTTREQKYLAKFCELVKVTAKRDGITPHPDSHYQKMFATIPAENLKLYVAEYEGKVIAANLVVFYGNTATYLHGASDNESRNVMAPFLLQWRQIQDAKKAGCTNYDFGGVSTNYESSTNIRTTNSWQGITRFKTGFSPNTQPLEFPGSYDIILNPAKYYLYRIMQKVKSIL